MLFHLIIACPERPGIVAAVAQHLAEHCCTIREADQHSVLEDNYFFMRYEVEALNATFDLEHFNTAFYTHVAEPFQMNYQLLNPANKPRVLLLASKATHCLEDVLYRWQTGLLPCEVIGVAGNHDTLAERVEWYQLPFYHIPSNNKATHFSNLLSLMHELNPDLTVLARYMQILPETICSEFSGKIINIHHSFLPAFVGAKPYHQAYQKGVKLIGATCHYVTANLDQGPIIEQDTKRVTHKQRVEDYIRLGKNVEREVLATGLRLHLENRVIIHGNKTIVFNG